MTYDEYAKIENESPYLYTLVKHGQGLWYFGAHHSFNPADEQFITLRTFWNSFINHLGTDTKRGVALVEGGVRRDSPNETDAIIKDGEAGFVSFLASKQSILLESPEPPLSYEFQELSRMFKKEEIYYYYFARIVSQWNTMSERPDFITYINKYLVQESDEGNWPASEYTLSFMREIHRKQFGKEFNSEDKTFFQNIVNPMRHIAVTNKVAQESGKIRDMFIIGQIREHWDAKRNIFIAYGDSHAVMQEKILKEILI